MSLGNIGVSGLILILVVVLLLFGPSKLPELGRAFGKSLREFKEATTGMMDEVAAMPPAAPQRVDAHHETAASSSTSSARSAVQVEPIELKEDRSS